MTPITQKSPLTQTTELSGESKTIELSDAALKVSATLEVQVAPQHDDIQLEDLVTEIAYAPQKETAELAQPDQLETEAAPQTKVQPKVATVLGHRLKVIVPVIAALVAGVFMALQSRMNGQLAVELGEPLQAGAYSFATGLLLMLALSFRKPEVDAYRKLGEGLSKEAISPLVLFAGCCGAFLVIMQAVVVPIVGVAVFTVSVIAGQTVGSLIVDGAGLAPRSRQRVTWMRVGCAALAVVGVATAALSEAHLGVLLPALAGTAAGAGTSFQAAWNGHISLFTRRCVVSTTINFGVGLTTVVVVWIMSGMLGLSGASMWIGPWWVWWGGIAGVIFVAITAVTVRHLGVLTFTLLTVCSHLVTATVLDFFNPQLGAAMSVQRFAGLLITATAAILAGRSTSKSNAKEAKPQPQISAQVATA